MLQMTVDRVNVFWISEEMQERRTESERNNWNYSRNKILHNQKICDVIACRVAREHTKWRLSEEKDVEMANNGVIVACK